LSALVDRLAPLRPRLIVLEASGGYKAVVVAVLAEAGLPVANRMRAPAQPGREPRGLANPGPATKLLDRRDQRALTRHLASIISSRATNVHDSLRFGSLWRLCSTVPLLPCSRSPLGALDLPRRAHKATGTNRIGARRPRRIPARPTSGISSFIHSAAILARPFNAPSNAHWIVPPRDLPRIRTVCSAVPVHRISERQKPCRERPHTPLFHRRVLLEETAVTLIGWLPGTRASHSDKRRVDDGRRFAAEVRA
jgi:hypothetical protein